jgi:hypothetical protein
MWRLRPQRKHFFEEFKNDEGLVTLAGIMLEGSKLILNGKAVTDDENSEGDS